MCSALVIAENELVSLYEKNVCHRLSDVLVMQGDNVFESQRETK